MTHLGKRSRRRRHLHLVGEDGLRECCRAHSERAKRDTPLLCVTNADGVTQRYSTCPTCRTVLVIDWYDRGLLRSELRDLREEMEVMSGEALPRLDTAQKRPWWQTQGALAVAVLLMFVAAAVIGKACKWLGH